MITRQVPGHLRARPPVMGFSLVSFIKVKFVTTATRIHVRLLKCNAIVAIFVFILLSHIASTQRRGYCAEFVRG
jgi:hypothetical protein